MWTPVPFAATPTNVSTLTTLVPFTDWSTRDSILFALINLDSTNSVTLRLETSQDGTHPDGSAAQEVTAGPGQQASMEIGPRPVRRYWRLSAYTSSPSFPVVAVKFEVSAWSAA